METIRQSEALHDRPPDLVDGELCERVGALALDARQEALWQLIVDAEVGQEPAFAIDLGRSCVVAANVAGRAFWGLRHFRLAEGFHLDAAMPALRSLRSVGGPENSADGTKATGDRIFELTFWTPSGSNRAHWKVASASAPELAGIVVVSMTAAPETATETVPQQLANGSAGGRVEDPVMLEIARMVAAAGETEGGPPDADADAAPVPQPSVAVLSHELRTPLTSVIGFAEVMQSGLFGRLDNPKYQEYVGIIVDSARHALALVEVAAEHASPHAEEDSTSVSDLLSIARSSVAAMALIAERSGVALIGPSEETSVLAEVSPTSLRQILFNLVSNAINATPAGGRVAVSVGTTGDGRAVVDVADTGPGLPVGVVDQLREQPAADSEDASAAGPHGLGLGVIRRLAFAHGGELSVVRTGAGGTTIEVRFRQPQPM